VTPKEILGHIGQIGGSVVALVKEHPEIADDVLKLVTIIISAKAGQK